MSKSRRPAERQLAKPIEECRKQLLRGFKSRKAVLFWLQRLCVRTLGEIPCEVYRRFGINFRGAGKYDEGTKLACFLSESQRTRPIDNNVAQDFRMHWSINIITPTQSRAFRAIRSQATEYVGENKNEEGYEVSNLEPKIALRPAISELDKTQSTVLQELLGDGLATVTEVGDFADNLINATRGEPVADGREPGELIKDMYNHPNSYQFFCGENSCWRRYRQMFACRQLLPAFNRAVQDLTNRSIEEPNQTNSNENKGPTTG